MKTLLGWVAAGIGALVILFALNVYGMLSWSFFGKWGEEIRYDIHKESQAYRDGMQRNLMQLQTEYVSADSSGKSLLRATIKHQYSQTDTSEYPEHLKTFLRNEIGIF